MPEGNDRLLVVSHFGGNHLGSQFQAAGDELGLETRGLDMGEAHRAPWVVQRVYRMLRGDRPLRLRSFSQRVLEECRAYRPTWCLTTGRAPIEPATLRALRDEGVVTINFSSDDPWNPLYHSRWLLEATPVYARVFTPRTSNVAQFESLGCPFVRHLCFGYSPPLHHPAEEADFGTDPPATDAVFIGGADRDRVAFIEALRGAGLRVRVYGGYWNRYRGTRDVAGGFLDVAGIRAVIARSKVSVCLVRRANRDGHVMRTFEEPAMGACMLFEDTPDHRTLFGEEATRAAGFRTPEELAELARRYCADAELRAGLRKQLRAAVVGGANTYRDRLESMLRPTDG